MTAREAALAYARGGWFVGPAKAGSKNPGSVLGVGWQHATTRDPKIIERYWSEDSQRAIFLHAGPSGAVIFDVDHPDAIPGVLAKAISLHSPPFQSTRRAEPGKGHYVFACPPDAEFGNSVGALGSGWGEVRSGNGVIMVQPSVHAKANEGGCYRWEVVGTAPLLPDFVAGQLSAASASVPAVTVAEVERFLSEHTAGDLRRMNGPINWAQTEFECGASRHDTICHATAWAMREAAAGLYPARQALDALRELFLDATEGE